MITIFIHDIANKIMALQFLLSESYNHYIEILSGYTIKTQEFLKTQINLLNYNYSSRKNNTENESIGIRINGNDHNIPTFQNIEDIFNFYSETLNSMITFFNTNHENNPTAYNLLKDTLEIINIFKCIYSLPYQLNLFETPMYKQQTTTTDIVDLSLIKRIICLFMIICNYDVQNLKYIIMNDKQIKLHTLHQYVINDKKINKIIDEFNNTFNTQLRISFSYNDVMITA